MELKHFIDENGIACIAQAVPPIPELGYMNDSLDWYVCTLSMPEGYADGTYTITFGIGIGLRRAYSKDEALRRGLAVGNYEPAKFWELKDPREYSEPIPPAAEDILSDLHSDTHIFHEDATRYMKELGMSERDYWVALGQMRRLREWLGELWRTFTDCDMP